MFNNRFIGNIPQTARNETKIKIYQYLATIWRKVQWHLVMAHCVVLVSEHGRTAVFVKLKKKLFVRVYKNNIARICVLCSLVCA